MTDLAITPEEKRTALALRIKAANDVAMPRLAGWNYEACPYHDAPRPDCEFRLCGGELFKHQRVEVAFFSVTDGILASMTGLGKTNVVLFLAALWKERGKLTNRMVVTCQAAAVAQWLHEINRFAPRLSAITATGTRSVRIGKYASNWDVCIIGYQMMLRDRDILEKLAPFSLLVEDDVDPIRNDTQTHHAYGMLARWADRVVNINATPLQIRLQEMYRTSLSVGGFEVFGSERAFERRYVRQEPITIWTGKGRKTTTMKTVGYKNLNEFKAKVAPLYVRHTYDDVDDVRIPEIAPPEDVWLELHPAQRKKYDELQTGVLKIIRDEGDQVKRATALTKVLYGAQICAGLATIGEEDGPNASIKLDWLLDKLTGDWTSEKVVIFSRFKPTIRAFLKRAKERDVGTALIWGDDAAPEFRAREQTRFWEDRKCRAIIGTSAIERSLNLQNAHIVVNFDTLLNPGRMIQILGRTRRVGSSATHVFVFNLLCRATQEEKYLPVLEKRQALADFVWGETSELYDALSPLELLELIRP